MSTTPTSRTLPTSRSDLSGRRVVVLGLARSGAAATRFLADAGASMVTVYDRLPADALTDAIASLRGRPVTLALAATPAAVRALLD